MITVIGDKSHHCVFLEVKRFTSHTAVATMTPLMKTQNATPIAR